MNNPTHSSKRTPSHGESGFLIAIFIINLCLSINSAMVGWNNPINDRHSFRQSQTAITAYWMKGNTFKVDYETPLLGKPWSIPLEFPIYQLVTSRIASLFNFPLDQTGRGVSLAAFLLIFWATYCLLGAFEVAPIYRLAMLSILSMSPFYVFWSRTFMIETTSLFFSISYIAFIYKTVRCRHFIWGLLAVAFGIAGALSKITTWLPFMLLGGMLIYREWLVWPSKWPAWRLFLQKIPLVIIFCLLPFVIAALWVCYADSIKATHPMASMLTSESLSHWNYGTLAQKLSPSTWYIILRRFYTLIGPASTALFILPFCVFAYFSISHRRLLIIGCLGFYLLGPLIFTNLHFVHDYYMCANGIFFLAAIAFLVIAALESNKAFKLGWTLFILILVSQYLGQILIYRPVQTLPPTNLSEIVDMVQQRTDPDSILVTSGLEWNATIPYYSERRSLMIYSDVAQMKDKVNQSLQSLKGEKIQLVIFDPSRGYSISVLKQQLASFGFFPDYVEVSSSVQR